jgi:hypothetical protein
LDPVDLTAATLETQGSLLFQNANGQAVIWQMNGTTPTGGAAVNPNPGSSWQAIGTGDFFCEGASDILWQNNTDGDVAIWEMNGATAIGGGTLTPNPGQDFLEPGPSWKAVGTCDFNHDGYSDILFQNTSGQVAIWEINGSNLIGGGTGVIGGGTVGLDPGSGWKAIGSGNFTGAAGAGNSDILFQNAAGQVAIWEMNGANVIGGGTVGLDPGPGWKAIGTGDFTGAGDSDILFQNAAGQVAIWQMDGTNVIGGGIVGLNPGSGWHAIGAGGEGSSDILFQNPNGQTAIWDLNGTNVIGGGTVSPSPGSSWKAISLS